MNPHEAKIAALEKEVRRLKRYAYECRQTHRQAAMAMVAYQVKSTPVLHTKEKKDDEFIRRMWAAFERYDEETRQEIGVVDFTL